MKGFVHAGKPQTAPPAVPPTKSVTFLPAPQLQEFQDLSNSSTPTLQSGVPDRGNRDPDQLPTRPEQSSAQMTVPTSNLEALATPVDGHPPRAVTPAPRRRPPAFTILRFHQWWIPKSTTTTVSEAGW